MLKDVHTRPLTGRHYINNLYSAQDGSVPSEQKKNRGRGDGEHWECDFARLQPLEQRESERKKSGLLNLKQCWGLEDGLLFIATDFLFKRALLLCFLSRWCCIPLTSFLLFLCSCTLGSTNKGRTQRVDINVYRLIRPLKEISTFWRIQTWS